MGDEWLASLFERHRPHLRAVAYRMLGSLTEADDAVQDAWLRLSRSGAEDIENLGGWLTTVVARVCLNMLRSRNHRREQPLAVHLPDPVISQEGEAQPEEQALLADSVGLALLVVLETLSPAERLAFVLHDMFAVPFEEIAPIIERSVAATRQLASRARRRVRGASDPQPEDLAQQRRVVDAFLEASRNGDFEALLRVLDPDVVFRGDAGSTGPPVPGELQGADQVARLVLARGTPMAPFGRPAVVNGRPGAVVVLPDRIASVVAFTIEGGRVVEMDLLVDPLKLRNVRV